MARLPMAVLVGCCSVTNSVLGGLQKLTHGKRISATELTHPPIFIIGHWRSGTTLMHELISMDDQLAYPSNFEAFVPQHFLLSRALVHPIIKLLMPSQRPMDAMQVEVDSPQEDDFALLNDGAPTPYRRIAFPNETRFHFQHLNLDQVDPAASAAVRRSLEHFYRSLTIRYPGKRLVLKSPPHTGRIKQLAKWFPGAKFVHMARHPHKLVSSTMRLWKLLDQIQGFQLPKYDDQWLKNYIFQCQSLMYESYLANRNQLSPDQLVEVKFEDLIQQPSDTITRIYEQLGLEGVQPLLSKVVGYFEQRQHHKTNPVRLDEELVAEIDTHWKPYADAFGY